MDQLALAIHTHLERVKDYFSNIFLLLEQSLTLQIETQLEQRIELNSNIQNLMIAASQEFALFQSALREARSSGAALDEAAQREVDYFCEQAPQALRVLKSRLEYSAEDAQRLHGELKLQLLKLQQNQKGFQGYKTQTSNNPRMLDSTI